MPHMTAGERALHLVGRPLVRFFYRVQSHGLEHLPEGGFLLLPNHITWVDALVLQLACPRPIRYIIDQEFYKKPMLRPILRTVGCIPIDIRRSRSAILTGCPWFSTRLPTTVHSPRGRPVRSLRNVRFADCIR